jgi:hypothetical protein
VIPGFGLFGHSRGVEESHVCIAILDRPADPIWTFAAHDHPEAAVVDRKGSWNLAGHDHFHASAALTDAYDGSLVMRHLFSPLGRVLFSFAAPDAAESTAALYDYQEPASPGLVGKWHSEIE